MKKQEENNPNIMFGSAPVGGTPVNTFRFGSSRSKYDFNLNTNLEEQRAANQGFWDSAGNIGLRLLGRTGMSALETGAMLGYGLPKAVVTGDLNALFDNELTDGFKQLDKVLIDNTPFYQSEAERNAPLFSKQYLTSTNFWGNLIGEGGGFVAGAILGGGMVGKTMGLANRVARSAGIIASDAEKIAQVAIETPNCMHWLPTREYSFVKQYIAKHGSLPKNLIVRLSAMYVDKAVTIPASLQGQANVTVSNVHTSTPIGLECQSPKQGGKCLDCRVCWSTKPVSYKIH